MSVSSAIRRQVETRAMDRCEYCGMHQSLQGGRFHIEHIVPSAAGGSSIPENLALACPGCNLRKADHVFAIKQESGEETPFFNPRIDCWKDHFHWDDYTLVGKTAIGRATVMMLELNHPRRIKIRQAEQWFGLFPPQF